MSGGDAARWARVEAVLAEALERAPERRPAFLAHACADDAELRREVEDLLAAHAETGLFDEVVRSSDTSQGSEMDHPAGTRFGPYAVEGLLGRGGMGVVYLARRVDGEFEQEVALKVLPAGLVSDRLEQRFRAERQILARLSHPNVARLLDGGVDDAGRPWFAMERVRGTSLVEFCDTEGLGLDDRLDLYLTVCDAVQHAHQNLVVHRDLKPGNILVDENGTPRLLDFGIAKLLDPDAPGPGARETQVGVRVLTPAYAAPEQLRGEPANTASDVFQLGILLYELLTGVHPFPERTTGSPTPSPPSTRAVTREATRPSAAVTTREEARARGLSPKLLSQRLRGDLDAIVLKALREEPERRYASAAELAEDLRRHRARRPVRARPDTWAYRTGRFLRRNTVALGAGAVVVAGVAAFTAGIAREARRTALQ
ncbi:MAG: serine/threonine-protein kinase, partial [Gemmatimonadota bacterium]